MILVLAGTSEGKEVVVELRSALYEVMSAVVSDYGAQIMEESAAGSEVIIGELDLEGLLVLIRDKQIETIVDATHPFARIISQLAMQAADITDITYIRLERPAMSIPVHPLVKTIQHLEEIKNYLLPGQTLFSTLGSKNLPGLAKITAEQKIHLVVRVLPTVEALQTCEDLGMSPEQIIAMKGPFSLAMNRVQFHHLQINAVLSKESGLKGGVDQKIEAAVQMGIPIIIWTRPVLDYPIILHSAQAVREAIQAKPRKYNTFTGRIGQ